MENSIVIGNDLMLYLEGGSTDTNNFEALLKKQSLVQLREGDKIFHHFSKSIKGNKIMNLAPNMAYEYSFHDKIDQKDNTRAGVFLIFDPNLNSLDKRLCFKYQCVRSDETPIESEFNFYGSGVPFGLETNFLRTGQPNYYKKANLPAWNSNEAIWIPALKFSCFIEILSENSNNNPLDDKEVTVPIMMLPCINKKTANGIFKKSADTFLENRILKMTFSGGMPIMNIASFYGNTEVVSFLLNKGVDPNQKGGSEGGTCLHEAVNGGHLELITLLLSNGADQLIHDNYKRTPLHLACIKGDITMIKVLCRGPHSKKASLAVDNNGKKPHEICKSNYAKVVLEGNSNI